MQFLLWIHTSNLSVLDRWNSEPEGWERVVRVAMVIVDWGKHATNSLTLQRHVQKRPVRHLCNVLYRPKKN